MPLDPTLVHRLIGATETDSLVFLCGAGLSMAPPSSLPSAATVAAACYDRWVPIEPLDPGLRNDLAGLADYFYDRRRFATEFVRIVPWNDFLGLPNAGHAAIADLLLTRSAHAALSSNFDPLIENWARERKFELTGAVDGREATSFAAMSSPLVKFHGCMVRDKPHTIWTDKQFAEPIIQDRVDTCTQWINLHLPGKHLVVVGFWSDWGYLNAALASALNVAHAASVTVVDPDTPAALQSKAPQLWHNLVSLSGTFEHVPMSGADFLNEVRHEFSKVWARRFYTLGEPLALGLGVTITRPPDSDSMTVEDLYDFRRDGEGVSYARACTSNRPPAHAAQTALARLTLRAAGATNDGPWMKHGTTLIRVVNGAGQDVESVKGQHREPAVLRAPDIVLCAGSFRIGLPPRIIPAGRGASVVRAAGGGTATWLSFEEVKAEVGL
jgi:hypothetical protein